MTFPRDRPIALSFTDALNVLMNACSVPRTGRTAFEARVRHLQRLGLPARGPDDHGARIAYGIPELAGLATAFRFMAAFLPPALAVRYVVERWADLAPFVLAGAREALPASYLMRRSIGNGTIAIIAGNALADLGHKGRHDERNAGPLGRLVIVGSDEPDIISIVGGAGLLIDSRTYMPALVTTVAACATATDADLADELDRLRFAPI